MLNGPPEVDRMSAFRSLSSRINRLATLASLGLAPAVIAGCGHSSGTGPGGPDTQRVTGQSSFVSAPLPGSGSVGGSSFGAGGDTNAGVSGSSGGGGTAAPV